MFNKEDRFTEKERFIIEKTFSTYDVHFNPKCDEQGYYQIILVFNNKGYKEVISRLTQVFRMNRIGGNLITVTGYKGRVKSQNLFKELVTRTL